MRAAYLARFVGRFDPVSLIRFGGCCVVAGSMLAVGVVGCVAVWVSRAAVVCR